MSTSKERYALLQANVKQAEDNYAADKAACNTVAAQDAVDDNLDQARDLLVGTIADDLAANSDAIEAAYTAAQKAQQAVTDARANAARPADWLSTLTNATSTAKDLLDLAKQP